VLKGTAFFRSNLSLMASFYALLLFCNSSSGVRSAFIRKQLGISLKGAHRLCNTIRLHMVSIGVQSGPPIGVQKGPLCGCEDRLTLGAVFALLAA